MTYVEVQYPKSEWMRLKDADDIPIRLENVDQRFGARQVLKIVLTIKDEHIRFPYVS